MKKNKKKSLKKNVLVIEKMDFESVDNVFDALHFAFHPQGMDNPDYELDIRCLALWTLFLTSAGWTEDEFWAEFESRPQGNICQDCGGLIDDSGHHVGDDMIDDGEVIDDGKILPESKPN
jgi:hypothetical protein